MGNGQASERHGGNLAAAARRLGRSPGSLLDASASLVPFAPPVAARLALLRASLGAAPRVYPDRGWQRLRALLGREHGLPADWVLPGNGAAELFTWAARDAAALGESLLPTPGFADYQRALACWGGISRPLPLPLRWDAAFPQPFPTGEASAPASASASPPVLWLTNPHNPTGQLWSRASLEPLLDRHPMVICDEAFLPLVRGGEAQSLIPLLPRHPNLVVVRSLTKLLSLAGLRLGYALGAPQRLERWAAWRDPWPVNGLALAVGETLLERPLWLPRWTARVQRWTALEGPWLARRLQRWPQLMPLPSAANFLLVRGDGSLEGLRAGLEERHGILLRDCRSFAGLGERWLRIGLQQRRGHRRLLRALERELG
ncbi:aminotransferase class I/II-fold pyridoxal phosphate-dependent enzyme [Cyanobium sp. ATX 6A2]|uniref:pyridoxal phosphate-dependent aminotransferase n=1 Tax=Cyanobium sp. ATX 6A2 TaxID=2823700 RepID=UPI0020CD0772|nr:aminotransferase class I/II-fold pyridoxal phosphate-dependent enzyme [Cyanobium sp. ATX 6A2]MCP9888090.1 aminotransferase class I/II-fold pyridoxal phosphate-dependent enzyme [Cyanobium sp. ATX 6A2]